VQQSSSGITIEDIFDVLSNVHRRNLLIPLLESTTREEIAVGLDESEQDTTDSLIRMKHVHFPKLAAYGIIEWNKQTDNVSKGPAFDEIKPLLELLGVHEDELPDDWL
jgi:hypothetical protein